MRHPEVGMRALEQALELLRTKLAVTVDQQPRMEGRQLFALVRVAKGAKAPDKKANVSEDGAVAQEETVPSPQVAAPGADGAVAAAPLPAAAAAPEPVAASA
jgi:hypothetical protein